jgi:hypothetical protein
VLIAGGSLLVAGTATIVVSSIQLGQQRDKLEANCVELEGDECIATTNAKLAAAQDAEQKIVTWRNVRYAAIGGSALGAAAVGVSLFELFSTSRGPATTARVHVSVDPRRVFVGWEQPF